MQATQLRPAQPHEELLRMPSLDMAAALASFDPLDPMPEFDSLLDSMMPLDFGLGLALEPAPAPAPAAAAPLSLLPVAATAPSSRNVSNLLAILSGGPGSMEPAAGTLSGSSGSGSEPAGPSGAVRLAAGGARASKRRAAPGGAEPVDDSANEDRDSAGEPPASGAAKGGGGGGGGAKNASSRLRALNREAQKRHRQKQKLKAQAESEELLNLREEVQRLRVAVMVRGPPSPPVLPGAGPGCAGAPPSAGATVWPERSAQSDAAREQSAIADAFFTYQAAVMAARPRVAALEAAAAAGPPGFVPSPGSEDLACFWSLFAACAACAKTALTSATPSATTEEIVRRLFPDRYNDENPETFPRGALANLGSLLPPFGPDQLARAGALAAEARVALAALHEERVQALRDLGARLPAQGGPAPEGSDSGVTGPPGGSKGAWPHACSMPGGGGAQPAAHLGLDRDFFRGGPGGTDCSEWFQIKSLTGALHACLHAEHHQHFRLHSVFLTEIASPLQSAQLLLRAYPKIPSVWAFVLAGAGPLQQPAAASSGTALVPRRS